MGITIGIIAIKGGVGKTTVSSSLAADLANNFGKKVLLVDANYSAPNLGLHMGIIEPGKTIHDVLAGRVHLMSAVQNKFGVDVIPGSFVFNEEINLLRLKDKLQMVKEDYDFIVIDSSPSLNEEILSTMLASDELFLVSTPDWPTLSCSLKAAKLARQRGKPISGIILNKLRDAKFELGLEHMEEAMDIPVVARIPDDLNNGRALFNKIPVSSYNNKCGFSKEISNLSRALTGDIENPGFFRKMLGLSLKREQVNRQVLKEHFYERLFEGK